MPPHEPITILIADDHPVFRRGIREIIEEHEQFRIIAECHTGREAMQFLRTTTPQITILDLEMPGVGGFDVAEYLRRERAATSVIFLTAHDNESFFTRAIDLGACAYILKDTAANEIIHGIELVAKGEYYISPALSGRLLKRSAAREHTVDARLGVSTLTATERRVLHLIALDRSSDQIAEELNISPRTVDRHRSNINRKLGLTGSYALVRFALTNRNML